MATSFNNKYTELTDINYGNQIQNGDDILGEHINSALQNTAHLKTLLDNSVVRNAQLNNNKLVLTLATKGNNDSSATTTNIEFGGAIDIPITTRTIVEEGQTITIYRATIKDSIVDYGSGLYAFTFKNDMSRHTHVMSIDTSLYGIYNLFRIYFDKDHLLTESNTRNSSNDDLYFETSYISGYNLSYLVECKKIIGY